MGLGQNPKDVVNMQDCKLEAILVLRIQDGNDIFVSVAGKYHPSFFGVSLQRLSILPRCVFCLTTCLTGRVTCHKYKCCTSCVCNQLGTSVTGKCTQELDQYSGIL